MQRIQYHQYGGPDVMQLVPYEPPAPGQGEVLVRVRAASVNPLDWKLRQGFMKLMMGGRFPRAMGLDLSGTIEAVGPGVVNLRPGDEVLGTAPMKTSGAFSHAAITTPGLLVRKPASLGFAAAAALPSVGVTAWRALVDAGRLRPGQSVLINGAAGGVGQAAIGIAQAFAGAVTVRVGPSWALQAQARGIDRVLDYNDPLPQDLEGAFDIVFDCHGGLSARQEDFLTRRSGVAVDINPSVGNVFRSLTSARHRFVRGVPSTAILQKVVDLSTEGRLPIDIGRTARLADAIALIADLESGKRVPGKAVIVMD